LPVDGRPSLVPGDPHTNAPFSGATLIASVDRRTRTLEIKMSNSLAPKLVAELIGTFALVFIGAGAASIVGSAAGLGGISAVAFAHGLALMVFTCVYGRVSGGHMNPAVTIGVLAVGAITAAEALGYIVSQIVGGVAGAMLLRTVLGGVATGLGTPELAHGLVLGDATITITPAIGFVVEAVLAFFLVTVVLSTAVAGRAAHLAPVAVGLTLVFNILMGGALTGAAFNPARALGPMIVTGNLGDAWLYVSAPIVGAIIAAVVHTGLSVLTHERPTEAAAAPAE
jgi:aquaporin Z